MPKKPARMHKLPAHMAALWESTLANRLKYESDPEKFHFVGRHRLALDRLRGAKGLDNVGLDREYLRIAREILTPLYPGDLAPALAALGDDSTGRRSSGC